AISLIVSSIMIAIITYISVLERTKEIGILRAIGASKKDIKRVFRAETIIEGLIAGVLGVGIALLLSLITNIIVSAIWKIEGVATMPVIGAIVLIFLSIGLNVLAGSKPARMASKKDPVEALRTE
ncbi:MAG: FtsX-like permease family protein, partial [Clostridiales bacterium]|nr:FtsX-like permease family protein [Clostridiales bacterium]